MALNSLEQLLLSQGSRAARGEGETQLPLRPAESAQTPAGAQGEGGMCPTGCFVHGGVPEDVPSQLQNTRDGWSWGLGPSQPHSREHSRLAAPHSRHRCAATAPLPFLGKGKRQELLNFNSRMMT